MDLDQGAVVADRYRLERRLGVGGMGTVWLAHDQLLDAPCAIKLVDSDKRENEEVRVRFQREAKAAAQLRGQHVVDVFDHGIWEGTPYMVMELLEGEDLGGRLDRVGRLDGAATHRIIAQVARALTRAHAMGIVHRDLKPENIFLIKTDDGESAKVLDFGIARHQEYSIKDKTTKTGSFLGTPYYMSPEQARGGEVDHRSDLWALGVIVWQCLIGRPPFESDALGALLGQIMYDTIPLPSSVAPELPPEFDAWWLRAACRDREQRFQTAKELADALAEALQVENATTVQSMPPRPPVAVSEPPLRIAAPPVPSDLAASIRHTPAVSERPRLNHHSVATPHPLTRTRWSVVPELPISKFSKATWVGVLAAVAVVLLVVVFALRQDADPGTAPATAAAALQPAAPSRAASPVPSVSATPEPRVVPVAPAERTISADELPLAEDQAKSKAATPLAPRTGSAETRPRASGKKNSATKLEDSADYGI